MITMPTPGSTGSRPRSTAMSAVLATLLLGTALGLPAACGGGDGEGGAATGDEGAPAKRLTVYTSCFPVDWLTRRVAGDDTDVVNVLPAGEDPPEWVPPADVIGKLQQGDLIVINGAGFEKWVTTTTLPADRLVDSSAPIHDQLIQIKGITHSHGKKGAHTHTGTDPHTWSDPANAVAQAQAIRDALSAADPGHAEGFDTRFQALKKDLDDLAEAFTAANAGYDGQVLATSHPAFNYIGRRLGWTIANFGFEPGEDPDAHQFEAFADRVQADHIAIMLWEAMPGDDLKARFEATGVRVVFLDPLEQPPDGGSYDYLSQARANVETIRQLFPAPAETAPAEAAPAS